MMVNSLKLGEILTALFLNDDTLKNLVGNKVFPIVAKKDCTFPFLVYQRNNISSNACKDGFYEDTVSFSITIVAEVYDESIDIATAVRKILEKPCIEINDSILYYTSLSSCSEEYTSDVYVQKLSFKTQIQ